MVFACLLGLILCAPNATALPEPGEPLRADTVLIATLQQILSGLPPGPVFLDTSGIGQSSTDRLMASAPGMRSGLMHEVLVCDVVVCHLDGVVAAARLSPPRFVSDSSAEVTVFLIRPGNRRGAHQAAHRFLLERVLRPGDESTWKVTGTELIFTT
jgi:hypothetical protein